MEGQPADETSTNPSPPVTCRGNIPELPTGSLSTSISTGINRARSFGFLGGLILAMAAGGVFWPITPMAHPDATALQALLVIAQVVLGPVLAVWCWVAAGRVGEVVTEEVGSDTEKG